MLSPMSLLHLFQTAPRTFADHAEDFEREMRKCSRDIQQHQRRLQRCVAKQQREIKNISARKKQSETQAAMSMLRCARLAAGYQMQIGRLERIRTRFETTGHKVAMAKAQTSSLEVMQRASKSLKAMDSAKLDIGSIQRVCHDFERHLSVQSEKAEFMGELMDDAMATEDDDLDVDRIEGGAFEGQIRMEAVQSVLQIAPQEGVTKEKLESLYNHIFSDVPQEEPSLRDKDEIETDMLLLSLPDTPKA